MTSISDAMDGAAADAATKSDAKRAFAVLRGAFVRNGGVAAVTTVLRSATERDVVATLANDLNTPSVDNNVFDETAGASTQESVTDVLRASAALLARARDGGKDARTEFRVA